MDGPSSTVDPQGALNACTFSSVTFSTQYHTARNRRDMMELGSDVFINLVQGVVIIDYSCCDCTCTCTYVFH